jgi:hypothetical protein
MACLELDGNKHNAFMSCRFIFMSSASVISVSDARILRKNDSRERDVTVRSAPCEPRLATSRIDFDLQCRADAQYPPPFGCFLRGRGIKNKTHTLRVNRTHRKSRFLIISTGETVNPKA